MKMKIESFERDYYETGIEDEYDPVSPTGPFTEDLKTVIDNLGIFLQKGKAVLINQNKETFPHIADAIFTPPRYTILYYLRGCLWESELNPVMDGWTHTFSLAGPSEDVDELHEDIMKVIIESITRTLPKENRPRDGLENLYEASEEARIYNTDKKIDMKWFKSISRLETFLKGRKI